MRPLQEASIATGWKSFLAYRDRRLQGILTGIKSIDQSLLGLGGVVVIQGETGSKKSTLALQIAHHNLKQGNPVLMLDRENGPGRVRSRLICQAEQVSETDIKCASVEQLRKWATPITELPLYIYTESVDSFQSVRERLQEMQQLHEGRPSILLVDSIQAMPSVDDDQRVSLEKWMYALDSMKVESDGKLTVIITSEKNRASYGNDAVGGAKGSNSVEYKSEQLWDVKATEDGKVQIKVLKNRDGERGQLFTLESRLAHPGNSHSFTFTLTDVTELGL